ncbi:hypothetical protein ACRALDRAFT_2053129 [Sodiomyces alcalophilus JCM 7366]|uniref:uncharacterized protein n=1 Tax=Sodiomyces alcalophilus JCM 7366 TaxID=591952 RepID=UPI0039B5FE97
MSGSGLTSNQSSSLAHPDSESEQQSPSRTTAKSTSEILSGVYRGFKKFTPSREESLRKPSLLGLRSPTPSSSASAPSSAVDARPAKYFQHARSLSLQSSLEKPLPVPPSESENPDSSEADVPPTTCLDNTATNFGRFHEQTQSRNMEGRMDSVDSSISADHSHHHQQQQYGGQSGYNTDMNSSQASLASSARQDGDDKRDNPTSKGNAPTSAGHSPSTNPTRTGAAASSGSVAAGGGPPPTSSSAHLSGLMCNVHRTTGKEPHALVGATTTILGDKLYVFGGRVLSRSRPNPLTSDLYELDLIRRHWTKLETVGDIPPPRYFHSMCALGDTKMVCYGGMSPTTNQSGVATSQDQQPEVTVMSDIYIYDVPTKRWTFIPTQDAPQGRYAHCACILPSSATFTSPKAPFSALQHNPSSGNPNEGRIGISIDGAGGAEMVVVGGQDGANHYIEQISVFNLRSLKWTSTQPFAKSCGAYRSVVAPLPPSVTSRIGKASPTGPHREGGISQEAREPGSSMLIYSNYNFLDVKLELQIRGPDGSLSEKPMSGTYSPPGLRFPNGGVIDTYFVVSGTYLTSSKQEYALWALDLRTLSWSRIDAGGSVFSQGSWNRGVLWNRRNTFVILGNRKRSLVDDYNHRRINFSNVCMVELEAFGFYDNPRRVSPMSGFVSSSSPATGPGLSLARKTGWTAGGRSHSRAAEELGEKALAMRELADMDILCLHGERIPVNSRILARRWGPYFVQSLREGAATQDGSDVVTLRSAFRNSSLTITPSSRSAAESSSLSMDSTAGSSITSPGQSLSTAPSSLAERPFSPPTGTGPLHANGTPTPESLPPGSRPRCLYLPHTYLTVQALLHFLYTSSLPAPSSPLCTPPILCSLLQIARPYRIDGLLEAVVERLHVLLDSRNAAAVFNATAMAAGGGRGIDGSINPNFYVPASDYADGSEVAPGDGGSGPSSDVDVAALRLNTALQSRQPSKEELSATTSASGSEWGSEVSESEAGGGREIWSGELSAVIGLQKRGLRGLMEGRRMRERTGTNTGAGAYGGGGGPSRAGLGIGGSS